ncbi:helix-turn-helix domain-containing protein [Haloarcula onubensis]|uniref:Helix-turn-helix domain-containing protein n=1 Tax=Haloarcula onubensis TaxID=2950539 RepID=A0ABU2FQP0_9EURY|nr:helix-turn-helix domain-containing protein [Halomicroarcula sp. S3CR25-11]MDS0282577.1 helix-turn-helix domain-containing protein [Halomicroarcula sp. S3CR25-11]
MAPTITDIRVPADAFPLGRLLQAYPDIEIELERLVPTEEEIIPLFWVESEYVDDIRQTLGEDPLVEEVIELTRLPDRALYSVNWSPDIDALVGTLVELKIHVLGAEGTASSWEFRLQFPDRELLATFRRACRAHDVPIELLRLYNPTMPAESGPLTPEQRDALVTAYEHGYWGVPRGITQTELADLVGISDNSMSQRLRRGVEVAVAELLYDAEEMGQSPDDPER